MNTLKTHSFALFSRFSCQQGPLVQSFHVKMFGLNSIRKNWDVDENQNYIFFKIAVLLPKFGFFLSIFLLNFFMTLARPLPDTCQRLTRTLLTWHQTWGQKHARVPYLYILNLWPNHFRPVTALADVAIKMFENVLWILKCVVDIRMCCAYWNVLWTIIELCFEFGNVLRILKCVLSNYWIVFSFLKCVVDIEIDHVCFGYLARTSRLSALLQ